MTERDAVPLREPRTQAPGCVSEGKARTLSALNPLLPTATLARAVALLDAFDHNTYTTALRARKRNTRGEAQNHNKKKKTLHSRAAMTSMSPITTAPAMADTCAGGSVSPTQVATPKNVAFELLFLESPQYRARLPMRVQIYPHDTTDSIVTTVKNFYGLYSGPTGSKGVSFEDQLGNTLIARYENFQNNMVVYVRVIEEPPVPTTTLGQHQFQQPPVAAPADYYKPQAYHHQQNQQYAQETLQPVSSSSQKRSQSPEQGPRSIGAQPHADAYEASSGYSSGDGAPGSASGRSKEHLGTTDISVENIVEGGRRKRAKFESSVSDIMRLTLTPFATFGRCWESWQCEN